MKIDFFLDTGVVFGHNYPKDPHYPECLEFFKKFKIKEHNFYSTRYILERELNKIRSERTNGIVRLIRLIDQRARLILPNIIDIQYSTHPSYKMLYTELLTYLVTNRIDDSPKDHDAVLLTNAHIWDLETTNLVKPHFMTVDSKDIGETTHKRDIQAIVNIRLSNQTRLKIELVSAMV
jgi:hypothetical protein